MRRVLGAISPYWPLIKIALLIGAVVAVWLHGRHAGVKSTEAKHSVELAEAASDRIAWYEGQLEEQRAAAAVSRAQSTALAGQLDRLSSTHAELRTALRGVKLISEEINRDTNCPDPRLSGAVRVCRNAAALGEPDAVSDCAAFGVSEPGSAGSMPAEQR